ncbi:hypothetical protein [Alicyclobacillus sp. SO9]|uniref:hypothetical protein n=1 Tax=Alicyclobacillus sp. SO9 TaxID=2665646 RepID=UPI0018E80C4D|nr:hypothetical protein [Alicyclobacillus sp. SO9]QQE77494.1 hypothetical protein GI364_16300 [Alicyclobacillus sp. SO9]
MNGYQGVPDGRATVEQDFEPLEAKKLYGGLSLWMLSMAVPFVMLVDLRYIMVGFFVSPDANQVLGALATIALIISGLWIGGATSAGKRGDLQAVARHEGYTMLFGWVGLVLSGWQLFNHSMNPVSHFGETYLAVVGISDFYMFVALIALISVVMRVKRLGLTINHRWAIQSTAAIWRFIVIAWIAMYILMYLI